MKQRTIRLAAAGILMGSMLFGSNEVLADEGAEAAVPAVESPVTTVSEAAPAPAAETKQEAPAAEPVAAPVQEVEAAEPAAEEAVPTVTEEVPVELEETPAAEDTSAEIEEIPAAEDASAETEETSATETASAADEAVAASKENVEAATATEATAASGNEEYQVSVGENQGIAINETNFPDAGYRAYVADVFDVDNDGILSSVELNQRSIWVEGEEIEDLKGLEWFKNVVNLTITRTKIKLLDLSGSNFEKLEQLTVSRNSLLEGIDLSDNKTINDVHYATGNRSLKWLDFRGCDNLEYAYHSVYHETVYISAGMNQYVGCKFVDSHTGNITIDLSGYYTVNPDGSKTVDLNQILAPNLIRELKKLNSNIIDPNTNILTISSKDKQVQLLAGMGQDGKNTVWTFYTELTNVDDRTVKFESNGGTIVEDQIIIDGEKAVSPADPTKSGSVFDGWFRDAALTDRYDFNAAVLADLILYAKWNTGTAVVPETPKPEVKQQTIQAAPVAKTAAKTTAVQTDVVETGDAASLGLYGSAMMGSWFAIYSMLRRKKREGDEA